MAERKLRRVLERDFIQEHNDMLFNTNEQGKLIRMKAETISKAFTVASTLVPLEHKATVLALNPDMIPPTILKIKVRLDYFDHKIDIMTSDSLRVNREHMFDNDDDD